MTAKHRMRQLLLCALACASGAHADEAPLQPHEVAADPRGAWDRFLTDPAYANPYDAYDALAEVGYNLLDVDAKACVRGRAALDDALLRAPVSVALHRARMLCAEATGDDALAEASMEAVVALSTRAIAGRREGMWPEPARVMAPADVYAVLASTGLEYRYEYFMLAEPRRHFPLVVAAWDSEAQVERHLWFDYVDSANSLVRGDPYSGFPIQRSQVAQSFLEVLAEGGDIAARDMQAVRAFGRAGAKPEAVDLLRPGAEVGGVQSAGAWLVTCALHQVPGCADGLVDALLPHAESDHAVHMALLAVAYATGTGVDQDDGAAGALLDAADRRWRGDGATAVLAGLWAQLAPQAPLPGFLEQRVQAAMARGNPVLPAQVGARKLLADEKVTLEPAELKALADPLNNGTGKGYALLSRYYQARGEAIAANGWLKHASDAGDADAQSLLGAHLLAATPSAGQRLQALGLFESGAHGGSGFGARMRALHSARNEEWTQAESWLIGSAQAGDVESLLALAWIYEGGHPGTNGTVQQAIDIYKSLSDEVDSAEARRRLAELAFKGQGMERDPARAAKLLRADAERGHGESAARLGQAYMLGELGTADRDEGQRWYERAIGGGYTGAHVDLGAWFFYRGDNSIDTRRRGIEIWRAGMEAGNAIARNNFAWALCTAPEPELFDAAAGHAASLPLLDHGDRSSWTDTVAACHAAVGEYARAVELQAEAMSALTQVELARDAARDDGFAGRLALYRDSRRYVERHRTEADFE